MTELPFDDQFCCDAGRARSTVACGAQPEEGPHEATRVHGLAARWRCSRSRRAQLPTIGFLGSATPLTWTYWVAVFCPELRELGGIENRTVAIEYRWAEGRDECHAEIAAEFIRLKVDSAAETFMTTSPVTAWTWASCCC